MASALVDERMDDVARRLNSALESERPNDHKRKRGPHGDRSRKRKDARVAWGPCEVCGATHQADDVQIDDALVCSYKCVREIELRCPTCDRRSDGIKWTMGVNQCPAAHLWYKCPLHRRRVSIADGSPGNVKREWSCLCLY
jgi:hypothetical protein